MTIICRARRSILFTCILHVQESKLVIWVSHEFDTKESKVSYGGATTSDTLSLTSLSKARHLLSPRNWNNSIWRSAKTDRVYQSNLRRGVVSSKKKNENFFRCYFFGIHIRVNGTHKLRLYDVAQPSHLISRKPRLRRGW